MTPMPFQLTHDLYLQRVQELTGTARPAWPESGMPGRRRRRHGRRPAALARLRSAVRPRLRPTAPCPGC
jgi:hypothetical protein